MPEGGGADAERIVVSGTEQVLVDVLHRGAEHEGWAAVGMLELYHIRHAVDDIGGINRLPGALHIARGYEIAKLGIAIRLVCEVRYLPSSILSGER